MAETVLPLRGGVILDDIQFPTDPGLYEPLAQPKRHSVHRTDSGGLVFQDGGITVVDNRVRLGSGSNLGGDPQLIDTTAVRELHRRFRRFGSTFTLTDWLGNEFTVFIAEFRPRIHRRDLWTYDMTLIVTAAARTLPVGPFLLTVENGTGGGEYAPGTVVTITANAPSPGMRFLRWVGATVASPTAQTTTLVMPIGKTFVEATYNPTGKFHLSVVNGSGDGDYRAGEIVTIVADDPPSGQGFLRWTGATVQSAGSRTTTLVMPVGDATVTATYAGAQSGTFHLEVIGGSGGGDYFPGTIVPITSGTAPPGQAFQRWETNPQGIILGGTAVIMPAVDATATAIFVPTEQILQVFHILPYFPAPGSYTLEHPWVQADQGPVPFTIRAMAGWAIQDPFFEGQVDVSMGPSSGATLVALYDAAMQPLQGFRTGLFSSGFWTGFAQINTGGAVQTLGLNCLDVSGSGVGGGSASPFYII